MNTMEIDGWCKVPGHSDPEHIDLMHFRVSEDCHLKLEAAEEELLQSSDKERFVEADLASMELELPPDFGPLSDCQFRVYINPRDQRGQFHLVGHRASDHSLVYSNAVMVDQLG